MALWWETSRSNSARGIRNAYDVATNDITESELEDFGLTDEELKYSFDRGFVDDGMDKDARHDARLDFLQWAKELSYDYNDHDFWDAWRSWYESTH